MLNFTRCHRRLPLHTNTSKHNLRVLETLEHASAESVRGNNTCSRRGCTMYGITLHQTWTYQKHVRERLHVCRPTPSPRKVPEWMRHGVSTCDKAARHRGIPQYKTKHIRVQTRACLLLPSLPRQPFNCGKQEEVTYPPYCTE